MEKITEMENIENDNIIIEIATRLAKIWKDKWNEVYIDKSNPTYFVYQGKKMGIWLKIIWSKVWDIPDKSDYVYTVYLWNLAICSDFYDVITEIQSEKWIIIEISDFINLGDCVKLWEWEYEGIKNMIALIEQSNLRDVQLLKEILNPITHHLNTLMSHYFISFDYGRFVLEANNREKKHSIINKDQKFLHDMNIIDKYFIENFQTIKSKIDNAIDKDKTENAKIRKEQEKEALE